MIVGWISSSIPLDDFLAGAGSQSDTGELLQRIGLIGSLTGITLATGLILFLATVHRGCRAEVRLIVRVAIGAGVLTVAGAATRIAGAAAVLDTSWYDGMSSASGSAAMMRLLAGVLIALGLSAHAVPVGSGADAPPAELTGNEPTREPFDTEPADTHHRAAAAAGEAATDQADEQPVRWVPSAASAFGLGGLVMAVLSFGFDGHTVTEGPRAVHALVDVVHVTAGSVWFGGLVGVAIVARLRRRTGGSFAALMIRFSSVATVAVVAAALAGVLMSLMITDGFGDYTGTDWGRILIVKTVLVAVVAGIGGYNHVVVVPGLEFDPDDSSLSARARRTVTVEAALLLLVAAVTVFLTTSSPN